MLITDLETFVLDFNDCRIFRYLTYRKMFTPAEVEAKYSDESFFEEGCTYNKAFIEEAIELGHGNWLLGFRNIYDDYEVSDVIEYRRLDEIQLSYFEKDYSDFKEYWATHDEDGNYIGEDDD